MANNVIKGLGFNHIALYASDYEKSRAFYEAIGMKTVTEWGEGKSRICLLDIGDGTKIELFAAGGDGYSPNGKWLHFAMNAENVEDAYRIALEAGAKSKLGPTLMPLDSKPNKMTIKIAFVYGPDGEQIEFFKQMVNKF